LIFLLDRQFKSPASCIATNAAPYVAPVATAATLREISEMVILNEAKTTYKDFVEKLDPIMRSCAARGLYRVQLWVDPHDLSHVDVRVDDQIIGTFKDNA
jgi:hypothetical protein